MQIRQVTSKVRKTLSTRRGRNAIVFACFLLVSAILWVVQSLNEDAQTDLSCRITITNIPDSVTRITPLPEAVNVSVRSRGTHLLKYLFSNSPEIQIDYRRYCRDGRLRMPENELKAYFRNTIGGNIQIMSMTPDSLNMVFTSKPGISMPLKADTRDEASMPPGMICTVTTDVDSVKLYTVSGKAGSLNCIFTKPVNLSDVTSSGRIRVAVAAPAGTRAIPDSVDVIYNVEPMVSRSVIVDIMPVNVPSGMSMITIPGQTEVYYMVPMSVYNSASPEFKVTADYRNRSANSNKVAVKLAAAPPNYSNIFIDTDSVEYLIEQ